MENESVSESEESVNKCKNDENAEKNTLKREKEKWLNKNIEKKRDREEKM